MTIKYYLDKGNIVFLCGVNIKLKCIKRHFIRFKPFFVILVLANCFEWIHLLNGVSKTGSVYGALSEHEYVYVKQFMYLHQSKLNLILLVYFHKHRHTTKHYLYGTVAYNCKFISITNNHMLLIVIWIEVINTNAHSF